MFNIGDKVKTRNAGIMFRGVVRNIYDFERESIYLIDIGGELVKRRERELELIREEEPKPDEITLTREEFIRKGQAAILSEVEELREKKDYDPTITISLMISGTIILKELEQVLFGEK